jgi:hypothetical protein
VTASAALGKLQSVNILDLKEFLENLPSPKQEEIVLPIDCRLMMIMFSKYKAEVVDAGFNFEDAN